MTGLSQEERHLEGGVAPSEDKDARIRLLEAQVDHLRAELELLKRRHAEAIYSVAWHFSWPVRLIEQAARARWPRKGRRTGRARDVGDELAAKPITPPEIERQAPSAQEIAQRIQRRAGQA